MTNPVNTFDSLVTVPYVTVASFRAYPSLVALGALNSYSASQTDQDAALFELLLTASQWAADTIDQPLHAHTHADDGQDRIRGDGRLSHHAEHHPVRQLTGFSYGYNGPLNMTIVTDLSNQWFEGDAEIVLPWGGTLNGSGLSSIQFSPPNPSSLLYARWQYVAGFANTTLAATAAAAATSIQIADAAGVYPGDVLRIYDPGKEEAVVVAGSYVPGATTVPLTAGLANTHTVAGTGVAQRIGVSMIPPSAREAVQKYTVAMLMRPVTQANDPWPGGAPKLSSRKGDSRGNGQGLISEACRLLSNYKRVR